MTNNTALASFQNDIQAELKDLNKFAPPATGTSISTKGKIFTLPNGQTSPGPMNAIIVDWRYFNSYFEGVYNASNIKPPVCWAINKAPAELTASDKAPKKQNDTCEECAMNQWGTGQSGRGKACKNACRLAIIPANFDEKTKPMMLNVSPTGLKQWGTYLNRLKTQLGMLPVQVTTSISFNPNEAYPSLLFDLGDKIDEDKYPMLAAMREKAQEMLDREPQLD